MKLLISFCFCLILSPSLAQKELDVNATTYQLDTIGDYIFFWNNTDTSIIHVDSTTYILKMNSMIEVKNKEKFIDYFSIMPKQVRDYTPNDFFISYNGQEINTIDIYIVDRFDEPVFNMEYLDSANLIDSKRGDFSSTLIRKQLLFNQGDTVDSRLFADTERNIRENTIYKDAIIKIEKTPHINGVNIKVYVHDNRHWKAIFWGAPTSLTLGGSIYDFLGISQKLEITGGGVIDPINPYNFSTNYEVKNIFKSQINLNLNYYKQNQAQSYSAKISRDFFAYNTKWAGMLKAENNSRKIENNGISKSYNNQFLNIDSWLARSFSLPKMNIKSPNLRFIISGRAVSTNHHKIPENQPFQNFVNKQFYITSFGFANRNWYGFEELYKFRQFDYVPKGVNLAVFNGYEKNQFLGGRFYNGLTANINNFYEKFGFMQNQIKFGSFVRNKVFEQITIQNTNTYFTNRFNLGKLGFRQFIKTNTTLSFNRPYSEFYNIGSTAIKGFDSQKMIGTKSLVINLEAVFYTPVKWWSSRGNFFFFADLGWIGRSNNDFIFNNTLYQGYGGGIRFQHRILAIDFMEVSFAYYPNGYLVNEKNWGYQIGDIPPRSVTPENLYSPSTLSDIY